MTTKCEKCGQVNLSEDERITLERDAAREAVRLHGNGRVLLRLTVTGEEVPL